MKQAENESNVDTESSDLEKEKSRKRRRNLKFGDNDVEGDDDEVYVRSLHKNQSDKLKSPPKIPKSYMMDTFLI